MLNIARKLQLYTRCFSQNIKKINQGSKPGGKFLEYVKITCRD